MKRVILLLLILGGSASAGEPTDPYLWLESTKSPEALAWVKVHTEKTLQVLQGDFRFDERRQTAEKILLADDRIPAPQVLGRDVYNFWQGPWNGKNYKRGVWRRIDLKSYLSQKPPNLNDANWEEVLDIDRLAGTEQQDWVLKSFNCVPPRYRRCLVHLSRGGQDAAEVREFDTETKAFVDPSDGGFRVPGAITRLDWIDENRLLIGTDFGPGSLTNSKLPRIVKVWTRGRPLAEAVQVLEADAKDWRLWPQTFLRPSPEKSVILIRHDRTQLDADHWLVDPKTLKVRPFLIPNDARLLAVFQGYGAVWLRSEWDVGGRTFAGGSLVAIPIGSEVEGTAVQEIFRPDSRSSVDQYQVVASRDVVFVVSLNNVRAVLREYRRDGWGQWSPSRVTLPRTGSLTLASVDPFSGSSFVWFQDFLHPSELLYLREKPNSTSLKWRRVRSSPARFDSSELVTTQYQATSADGTRIPYFVVHRRDLKYDGENPTLMTGYGGFEVSFVPGYSGTMGKLWLEPGGVYVLANVRGGMEFGPSWHTSVMGANRKKVYEDFLAVAVDLIRRKITSPRNLGIRGASNGGLLVGTAMVLRPELFGAVVCEQPVLDMLRFPYLGRGAGWKPEYGDPERPEMREILRKYSPYHQLAKNRGYPNVLFWTSTIDLRVDPAHGRKMAARMEDLGYRVMLYENDGGGHAGARNLKETALKEALVYTFLAERLWPEKNSPLRAAAGLRDND